MVLMNGLLKLSQRKQAFKRMMQHDLYTRKLLREKERSIEHVVPNRLLKGTEKFDVVNLWVIDHDINRFRSDYRFGGSVEEVLETIDEWEHVDNCVFRNRRRRVFFPVYGRPLVAMTCKRMFEKYEHLQDIEDQVFVKEDIRKWLFEDVDEFDMNTLVRKFKWMTRYPR